VKESSLNVTIKARFGQYYIDRSAKYVERFRKKRKFNAVKIKHEGTNKIFFKSTFDLPFL
jgi:hypothetical protein